MAKKFRCFVIMPYSEASDALYTAAIIPALRSLERNVLPLRPDSIGSVAITLQAHVEQAITSADFCIAEISKLSPNMAYEVGYASGVGKPVILIANSDNLKTVPLDLYDKRILVYDTTDPASFRNLLVKACTDVIRQLEAQKSPEASAERVAGVSVIGSSSGIYFEQLLASVNKRFSALVRSPEVLLRSIIPRLKQAAQNDLSVRIVCANPAGHFSSIEARELSNEPFRYKVRLQRALWSLTQELQNLPHGKYELRLTDNAIANSIYLSEDFAIVGPHFWGSTEGPQLFIEIERGTNPHLYTVFDRTFAEVWQSSVTTSTEVIQDIMEYTGTDRETALKLWQHLLGTTEEIRDVPENKVG